MGEDRSAVDVVHESKMMAYGVGAVTLIAGLILLFWPDRTLHPVVRIAGILLIFIGVVDLLDTLRNHRSGSYWGLLLVRAIINIGFGCALLFWPEPTITVLVWLIGLDLVLAGILGLLVRGQMPEEYRANTLSRSVLTIVFGVAVMVWPDATLAVVAFVMGGVLILLGLVFLWSGWRLSKTDVIEV